MSENEKHQALNSPGAQDDFRLIHGIGPAIEKRLHAGGIHTYAELASVAPEQVVAVLGDMIGLTTERVIKQEWISQAQYLASVEDAAFDAPKEHKEPELRQHYATFTVELLLDEENHVRRTRMVHIQSSTEDAWAGWDVNKLTDFLTYHAMPESSSRTIAETAVIEPPPIGLIDQTTNIRGEARLQNLTMSQTGTGGLPARLLPKDQPFDINLALDMTQLKIPSSMPVHFKATMTAKSLGKKENQVLWEGEGSLSEPAIVAMLINNPGLREGKYRIGIDLALYFTPVMIKPDISTPIDGGFVMAY